MKVATLGFIALCASQFAYADGVVHKCKDRNGQTIYQATTCAKTDTAVSSWAQTDSPVAASLPTSNTTRVLILRQQSNGHYFVDGAINAKSLIFVVDTGASMVSLPRDMAYMANMSCKEQVSVQTANGTTRSCTSVINKLQLGHLLLANVPAMIVPNLSQPLLGMNVLQGFRIEQDNGEMRLTPKN
ncbi:MAG: TIGR02281 family clan AA aspartic protease [Sideroxydans sp.]|nr:TIGR02281 family clan AA aspartic protease [Sideroxydans sp.]